MPYSRTLRSRANRRYSAKNTRRRTTYRRRGRAPRRTYRKRGGMGRKSLLNITSRKKRNGMLSWSNTVQTSGASRTTAVGPAVINGQNTGFFLWCPTAMDMDQNSIVANVASRSATNCFMKGLSENLRIQTSSQAPWFHRRICFTSRDETFRAGDRDTAPLNPLLPYVDTSQGKERLWLNANINNAPNTLSLYQTLMFKGTVNVDWNDLIVAPLDTGRITVKFDKTWTIQSGNGTGVVRERKLWHPMNKSLVYDDDEIGDAENPAFFSTDSRAGMGDYYVVDIFQGGTGVGASDLLQVSANSTMYWHER
nr:capsid protein [Tick-associated genomovirus 2]